MSIYEAVANSHPKLRRGRVWCRTCGRKRDIDAQTCLQGGWPMCHGETMTLDSPEERAARSNIANPAVAMAAAMAAARAERAETTVRTCTCLGVCRGADGLAPGWRCALTKGGT